ncbi:methyltransferase [Bacillus sp. BGMRC 2118]|nr:methyltransferase [Bacillus sp. BGMRC 2118]
MDKVLVEIYIPASDEVYDVFIPLNSKCFEILSLLSKVMTELSKGYFIATNSTVLCDRESGAYLNINMSIEELGLKNGSKLMLL